VTHTVVQRVTGEKTWGKNPVHPFDGCRVIYVVLTASEV
jgi:hypothetical protein